MADPQVNPNALGAPTEGFGQQVSFAFDPRGVTPSLQMDRSRPSGVGISGVSRAQPAGNPNDALRPQQTDGTAEFLMRVGGEILGPKIEQERNQKFVEGIQAAMQGEAVKDMATQQPWYSKIFGDTPMMEGARAYEVSSKVNDVVSQQTANMDQLKTLGPKEATQHFAGLIQSNMTGDPSTDALMAKHLIDQIPGLMKAQAKAYYGYGQQRAAKAMSTNMETAAGALQTAGEQYSQDYLNDEDFNLRKRGFVGSIMAPDGMNSETYQKTLTANLQSMAMKGQFHAINAIRESGGFDVLTEEQRNAVEKATERAGTQYRNKYAYQYVREIGELKSDQAHPDPGTKPKDIAARYQKMNDAYTKLTGNPQGLFTSDEMAGGVTAIDNAIKEEQAKAAAAAATQANKDATAAQKALAAAALDQVVENGVRSGNILYMQHTPGITKDMIDLKFAQMFKTPGMGEQGSYILRNNFVNAQYTNPIIAKEWQAPLVGAESLDAPTDQFREAVTRYQQLKSGSGGGAIAAAYYGDYAPKLERYLRMTAAAPDHSLDAQAYQAAFDRSGASKPQALDKKEMQAVVKTVNDKTGSFLPAWLGGQHLRPDTIGALADIAKESAEEWRGVPGMTDEEAVSHGIASALSQHRVEVLGGFAINRGDASDAPSLRSAANATRNVPAGKEDEFFSAFLASKGFDGKGSVSLHANGKGPDGSYRYAGFIHTGDEVHAVQFSQKEWADYAAHATLRATTPQSYGENFEGAPGDAFSGGGAFTSGAATHPRFLPYGPQIDYSVPGVPRPMSGAPSIYSDGDAWAQYHAKQMAESRKRAASLTK